MNTDSSGMFRFDVPEIMKGTYIMVVVDDIHKIMKSRVNMAESMPLPTVGDLYKAMSVKWIDFRGEDRADTVLSLIERIDGLKVSGKNLKYDDKSLALFLNGKYCTQIEYDTTVYYEDYEPSFFGYGRWYRPCNWANSMHIYRYPAGYRPVFEEGETKIEYSRIIGDYNAYEILRKIPVEMIGLVAIIRGGDNRIDFEKKSYGANSIAVLTDGADCLLEDDEKSGLVIIER